MIAGNHINIKMLRTVARHLGPLRERVVFLGGCATYLLITNTAIPEIRPTLTHTISKILDDDLKIRMVTAPYFMATKIEAFYGRGRNDFLGSHDMEDIITVIDGRPKVINEIKTSPDLRKYSSQEFRKLSNNEFFIESLSGHLRPDKASQARIPLLIERVKMIATPE